MDVDPGIARFDLMLELIDADEHLGGWLEYSTDLFEAATIARMAAHLRTLLEAIVANPEERISRLPLLPAGERRQVLFDWNDTQTPVSAAPALSPSGSPGRPSARRTPWRCPPGRFGSATASSRVGASAIADRLAREGVGPDVVVSLLAERGVDFLAAMIAVQQAGGAFLPLDPTLPAARLAQIIRHSRAPLVLAGQSCAAVARERRCRKCRREAPASPEPRGAVPGRATQRRSPVRPAPSSLAYVIYTSGSTGVPKGAMVEQRGLLNHLLSLISDLELSASDVVAQTAPQSFVICVWQFLAALMVGARVHICADEEVRDPALLVQEDRARGCDRAADRAGAAARDPRAGP